MKKTNQKFVASLDVDAQKGFTPLCPNELPVPKGDDIVNELNLQRLHATVRVGSKDAHPANPVWLASAEHPVLSKVEGQGNADLHWPSHCVPGTKGFQLLDGLPQPEQYDHFIWKGIEPNLHPYGACYHDLLDTLSTGLVEYLVDNKIQTVIVGGLATDYCVMTTCIQLLANGFKVILNLGACRAIDESAVAGLVKSTKATFNQTEELFTTVDRASDLDQYIEVQP